MAANDVLVDSKTAQLSIINLIDDFKITGAPKEVLEELSPEKPIFLPIQFVVLASWYRNVSVQIDNEQQAKQAEVCFIDSTGVVLVEESPVTFSKRQFSPGVLSAVISVVKFPFIGWGQYSMTIAPISVDSEVTYETARLTVGFTESEAGL